MPTGNPKRNFSNDRFYLFLFCGLAFIIGLVALVKFSDPPAKLTLGAIPFPADNSLTPGKIALGRKLFFDKRLSANNSIACASCHHPAKAFTDGRSQSRGIHDSLTDRNAPTLLNSAYLKTLMFDGEIKTLEMQLLVPLKDHREMGSDITGVIKKLKADPAYESAAKQVYGRSFDAFVLTRSLAAFERSLISQNSALDRFLVGDSTALTASQKRGWKLFSQDLYCTKCHPAPHFTNYKTLNNGLYTDYGTDQGRFRILDKESDKGRFKVPTLRNIELTAPYMHDGSMKTLEEVLTHYEKGGRGHVNQSRIIVPFQLSGSQRKDLLHFFQSLTDTTYLQDFQ